MDKNPTEAAPTFARTSVERSLAQIWAQLLTPEDPRPDELDVRASFFELGGHSLLGMQLLTRLRDQLGVELPLAQLFQAETIEQQAALVEEALARGPGAVPPLRRQAAGGPAARPLSFAQERLYQHFRQDPQSPLHNLPGTLRLGSQPDLPALRRALRRLEERHEVLRTRILDLPEGPQQVLLPAAEPALAPRREDLLELAARPFALLEEKPWRAELVDVEPGEQALFYNVHRIAFDEASRGIFERELAALYAAEKAGEGEEAGAGPAPLPVSYADFAAWQRGWLRGEALEAQLAHWRHLDVRPLALPADRPRPAAPSRHAAVLGRTLPSEVAGKAEAFGRERGAALSDVLLAAFGALLGRLAGQSPINVGLPFAGRIPGQTEGLLGHFANTLVVGIRLEDDPAFETLVERVRRQVAAAFAHPDLPFAKLAEALDPAAGQDRHPLYQATFEFREEERDRGWPAPPGHSTGRIGLDLGLVERDLELQLTRRANGEIEARARFALDLFEAAPVGRWLALYESLLGRWLAAPAERLSSFAL